jgi:DNA-directed RNA polymerase specialized sigma24 family protein
MLKSRSISTELWAHARQRLIFFFSRRLGMQNSEDLAHNTILAIWLRNDIELETEEDFLKLCYGFAKKVLQKAYRDTKADQWVELDPGIEKRVLDVQGLRGSEAAAFLKEVIECGEKMFNAEDWALIEAVAGRDENDAPVSGQIRTRMHRMRKKLAQMTGWEKSEV